MKLSNAEQVRGPVTMVGDLPGTTAEFDIIILAAGFEDRALKVISDGVFRDGTQCVLIRYVNNVLNNRAIYRQYLDLAHNKFGEYNTHPVALRDTDADAFMRDLSAKLAALPRRARRIAIDVSGMPSYLSCCVLKVARDHRPREGQTVLYTSADQYMPTLDEYQDLIAENVDEIELLPHSMALEMAENLTIEAFAGHRSSSKSCLAVLTGYEAHRAAGVIDDINPALLLLLYGDPGDVRHAWRLDLSRRLHRKFERTRRAASEVVSTLEVADSLSILEEYYNYLIDDYDLFIAPIGSKMQSVAAYLFWERYGEVHLTFPLPIGYNPEYRPLGVSTTYRLDLEPRRSLYRSSAVESESPTS